MINKYRSIVLDQLVRNPETRSDDKILIRNIVREKFGTTNIDDLIGIEGNIFESIRRCRQQLQKTNPMLKPDPAVSNRRAEAEQAVRQEVRGL